MVRCNSYCLYKALRIVNIVVNVLGVLLIVYSLWLLKVWAAGVAQLPSVVGLPLPWFIYVCIGVGIAVCMITLSGHMVANCISKSTLAIYTLSILSLVLIQAGVIGIILFGVDWEAVCHCILPLPAKLAKISRYIDEHHPAFKSFIHFHLLICRLIAVLLLVAQASIVAVAAILWVLGAEPAIQSQISNPHQLITQSFLTDSNSPLPEVTNCH